MSVPGHERLLARAAQHQHAHVVVGVGALARLVERLVHREGHRVVRLGAVERHPRRRAAALQIDLAHVSALDLVGREAGLAQDLLRVLAEQRRGAADRAGRVGELHRDAERPDRPLDRVLERDLHLARLRVRVVEDLRVVVDRPARDAALDQRRHPLVGAARGERGLELGDQLGDVGHAVVVGGEARVVDQLGAADRRAQPLEQRLVVAADRDVAVARAQRLVGRRQPVRGAELARHAAGRPQLRRLPDRQRERALEQRGVDVLAAAGALARVQRREDRDGAEQPGRQVADRDPALDRVAVGLAGDAHHARQPLGDQVVARPLRVRARSARSRRSSA